MSDLTFTTQSSFLHHGIMGQKWGVQNGPPYPLDRKAARAERKAERKEAKTKKKIEKMNRKYAEYAAKTKAQNEKINYQRAKNELKRQKAAYADMKRDKWSKDIYTGETQKEKMARSERDREFQLRQQNQKYQQEGGSLKSVLKKTLISNASVLLGDAVVALGKEVISSKLIEPYREKNMSEAQKAKKNRADYLENLQYQVKVKAAKDSLDESKRSKDDYLKDLKYQSDIASYQETIARSARNRGEYLQLQRAVNQMSAEGKSDQEIYRFIKKSEEKNSK